MFIYRKFSTSTQKPAELPSISAASKTTPIDIHLRSLSRFEKNCIDSAVKAALKKLPQRLVEGMATIPPANEEIAKLYLTKESQLQGDRDTAVNMIAMHAVMEGLIETRNKHWYRVDRERMSNHIDTYARESILREITRLSNAQKSTGVRGKNISAYVVGVSQKENNLLIQMTAAFMDQCIQTITESELEAANDIDLSQRPTDEYREVYASFRKEMGKAFSSLFKEFDDLVCVYGKNGALVGVDQRKLLDLSKNLIADQKAQTGTSEQRQWLATQNETMMAAMDRAASHLPAQTRNAWKAAYASQFLKGHDLQTFAESGAALWAMREQRKERAQKNPAAMPPDAQQHQWMKQAIAGLQAILKDNDGSLVSLPTTQASEEKTEVGDEIEPAPQYKSGTRRRGTFSDLRIAYEDNRTGVPWKDTRAQESIEKIAKPMMKRLLPEHRAGVLQALSGYGKNATRFFARHTVRIETLEDDVIIEKDKKIPYYIKYHEKVEEGIKFDFKNKQHYDVSRFQIWHCKASHVRQLTPKNNRLLKMLFTGNFISPLMVISPGSTYSLESSALHELGHVIDFSVAANMGLNRYKPIDIPIPYPISLPFLLSSFKHKNYSNFNLIKKEYVDADSKKSGLTTYAETNEYEFFAEAARAYFGDPVGACSTNFMTPGQAVFSAENLKIQHPNTFAALDELARAKFNVPKAKRSLLYTSRLIVKSS
jgi:hypothetical protein